MEKLPQELDKQQLIDMVLQSFEAESNRDVAANNELLHPDFAMTDMVVDADDHVFPRYYGSGLRELINLAFQVQGRKYEFISTAVDQDSQTVIVEFIESYPDRTTGEIYRTPQVAVCKIVNGKLHRTRHYMDPRLSRKNLTPDQISDALD